MISPGAEVVLVEWRPEGATASLGWRVRVTTKGLRIWRQPKHCRGFVPHPKTFDVNTGFENDMLTPGSYSYIVPVKE